MRPRFSIKDEIEIEEFSLAKPIWLNVKGGPNISD